MSFKFHATSSVTLLAEAVSGSGAPLPSAAQLCSSATSIADAPVTLPGMPAPAAMSERNVS